MREFPADLYRGVYSLFHALPILRIGCLDSIRGTSLKVLIGDDFIEPFRVAKDSAYLIESAIMSCEMPLPNEERVLRNDDCGH